MKSRLVFFAPLAAFLLLALYFTLGLGRDPSAIPSVLIDKPAPQFSLQPIEGYENGLSTDDLNGDVSLVNVFASWCVGCRIEHPLLMELAAENDLKIYGVNWKDAPGDGTAWLQRWGDPYTRVGDDADGRVAIDFGVTGAPETFLIDSKGRIRYKFAGPITQQIWDEDFAPRIEALRQ
ncbi:MAG: DsbE family thiol:disulfide interchange protein [Pseudomonadota bacterium]